MRNKKIVIVSLLLILTLFFTSCASTAPVNENGKLEIQILSTSDMHGKFMPYSYALNEEDLNGSCTQIKTAVSKLRNENTIMVDAGDIIQDNSSDIFLDDDMHPMMLSMNEIGYDAWVTGNHEFNYGMDTLKKIIKQNNAQLLCGNVYDENGDTLGDKYTIIEKSGVKIALIGVVTPNILKWDEKNLKNWKVTDPVEETKKVISEIKDQVDILVAVAHMDVSNEYSVSDSGVEDLANACPELNLIIAAHGHQEIEDKLINGVPIIENKNYAQTLGQIVFEVEKSQDGYKIVDTTTDLIQMADFESDKELSEKLLPYHERAVENAEIKIGELASDYLAEPNEISKIPTALIKDTALIDLINEVQIHYTDAKVSSASLFEMDANLYKGDSDIRKCDVSRVYKYSNTLYKLEMNGEQLKKWMEWSAAFYNTFNDGDLTISFNKDMRMFSYDMFAGVNYEINISEEPGDRIENLTWSDGTEVKDDDVFIVATNNYRASSNLTTYGSVFEEGEDLPKILEVDVENSIGGIRELIADYIINVKNGVIKANCDNNWKLTGYSWDEQLHKKAVEQLNEGVISITDSDDGRTPNVKSITEKDLK